MQLVLQPRHAHPRAERSGQSGGDHGFSEILQMESGKRAVVGGRAPVADGGQATSPFHLSIAGHRLADHLPAATAPEKVLPRESEGEASSNGEDVAEEDAELPETALLDLDATEPEEIAVPPTTPEAEAGPAIPSEEAASSHANAQVAQTLAAASAPRPEQGIRTGRSQSSAANGPDNAEWTASASSGFQRGERPAPGQAGPTSATSFPAAGDAVKDAAIAETAAREAATRSADRPEGNAEPSAAQPSPAGEGRADKPQLPASMRVVDTQSFLAPAPASNPAATVANAVTAAPDWMSLARSAEASPVTAAPVAVTGSMKTLTIQLHPAELGVVTARLQFADEQLSIELQVDKTEAYDRLSTDRDAILKAVRALGIEVDKVTIQHSPAQTAANPRGENSAAFNGENGRETGFSAQGGSGGGEGGREGHSPPNRHDEAHGAAGMTRGGRGSDQGGLYI